MGQLRDVFRRNLARAVASFRGQRRCKHDRLDFPEFLSMLFRNFMILNVSQIVPRVSSALIYRRRRPNHAEPEKAFA